MKRGMLDRLNADRENKRPVALVSETGAGSQTLVYEDEQTSGEELPQEVLSQARAALANDRSEAVENGGKQYFIQVHNPPLRLFIIGAVHITQPLAQIASLAGYGVTVIDPRRAFADSERFPGIEVSTEWPDDVLGRAAPDRRTAIVTLTHDPKIDDPALESILASEVFYIGSLGSNRTHGKRLVRLHEKGFSEQQTGRIHGPVGLNIGAKSPAEIAISIMAEITEARRMAAASGGA
ncbi:MAG: XdhC family protein [Rhodospirillaceae bacterium]|jgi:xanthine dehydrogenase accessory factor|nr:XdhC family protein [Rhodospirillaceae bacterium]MBT5037658.1 XdhC family protein [Rhodospirillaceae bacterium]MBT5677742.1 XdhC family protein [Rhodospirillaceae bacterium]MBT5779924.1 XdhC family protein [Rhodospirillaceae bacterium]